MKKTTSKHVIGIPAEYFGDGLDLQIRFALEGMINSLEDFGYEIKPVNLPLTKYGLAVYYTKMTVETAANLQRFEGVRYGAQLGNNPMFVQTRDKGLGDETKRRIMLGTFASSSGYYDAYYNTSAKVQELMKRDFKKVFEQCDLLIAPTTPEFAFKLGEKTSDPVQMYLSDALVYGANLAQIPAISIPLGMLPITSGSKEVMPTGIQVIANEFDDEKMYTLAFDIERLAKK
jgi:aspartyl-tRNA(Asn)/glutamyl-tRNA(Gln) amidotransferase subunit A